MKSTDKTATALKNVYRFSSLALAKSFANSCVKIHLILMGDHDGENGQYLVGLPRYTETLCRAGYEYV